MHTIYSALTSSSVNEGIKNIDVFYDTLFINFKSANTLSGTYNEYLLIEKLNYSDFELRINNGFILNLGNTTYSSPKNSNGNILIDNILLESKKNVLICGLSSLAISGHYIPTIHQYDINQHHLKKIYPISNSDINQWSNYSFGNYVSSQTPLVSLNLQNNNLNFIFQTVIPGISALDSINDLEFNYSDMSLTNVRQLTAYQGLSSNLSTINLIKFINYNDNEKLLIIESGGKIKSVNI